MFGSKSKESYPQHAYPNIYGVGGHLGMTLRDYFAGRAMQARIVEYSSGAISHADELAAGSYRLADAMMKARDGK